MRMPVQRRRPRRGQDDGATAVEFAMIATPLFFIIFAVFELAFVFIVSTTLEAAVSRAAREIRTGQAQAAAMTRSNFVNEVCSHMAFLQSHCLGNFFVDVRPTDWSDNNPPNPISNGTFNAGALTFEPGTASQIVLVRGFYKWTLFTPFLTQSLAKLSGNTAVIQTTETFRNEPFVTTTSGV